MVDVLTLQLDEVSQARFEQLRRAHFPAERNQIPAHLTLFHALPREPWITETLERAAERTPELTLRVTGLRSLGKGVAYTLVSRELNTVHGELAEQFQPVLPGQDRQRFQPHVVVQNKVTPEAAKKLLAELQQRFAPWTVRALGLDLWHYMGGPWEHARTFSFRPEALRPQGDCRRYGASRRA